MPDTAAADAKIKAWMDSPEGKKKMGTLDPNAPITEPGPATKPIDTPTGPQFPTDKVKPAFDASTLDKVHANTDVDTHEKLADIHAQQGNNEHAAWHKEQAASKKQANTQDTPSETAKPEKKKKHTVNDIAKMSHQDQASSLASSIESHIKGNQELSPKQKEIAQALLSAAQFHSNADELHPEAKKELSQIASIARKHGLHKPHQESNDYETLDGESEAPQGNTDWLAKFHEGRARGQGLSASAGSAYAAGHIGSQLGNYVSTEAVTQGHRLLTAGKKTSDDPGSSKAEAARAISTAEKDVRTANKQR